MARFGRGFPMPNIGLVQTGFGAEVSASVLLETEEGDQILAQRQVSLRTLTFIEQSVDTTLTHLLTGADKTLGSVGSLGIKLENPAVIPPTIN